MQKTLCEKELAHALFFSIKHDDLEHANQLVIMGAPVQTAFYLTQDTMAYTSNFLVGKVAEVIKKFGYSHARSRFALQLLDRFIEAGADFRCHCSPKNPHYCALSEAFKHITFNSQDGTIDGKEDLLTDNNLLVLKLLYHGATFKNHRNEKDYKWVGVDTLVSYLSTRRQEALELLSSNRHRKCATTK